MPLYSPPSTVNFPSSIVADITCYGVAVSFKNTGENLDLRRLDLSKEEKQVIYKKSNEELNTKLSAKFSKSDIKEIKAHLKTQNEKMKKK